MTRLFGQMKLRSYLIALVVATVLPFVIFASLMIVSGWSFRVTIPVSVPVSVADAPYWRSLVSLMLGSALLLLSALTLAYFIARRISNSIAALSGAAETLGRGDIPPAPASAIVEVNRVAQALEKAAAERKRAEDARSQLAAIVASSHNAIIGRTLDGTITSWNKGAEKIFGYLPEEAIGRSIAMVFPVDQMDIVETNSEAIRQGKIIESYEGVRLRKNGGRIHVAATVSPVKDENGNTVGVASIARDITERKRVEKELRISREHLRSLAAYLQSVREEERSRIARELHDEIGQVLTGIKFTLVTSLRHLPGDAASDLARALALTNELIGKVRDLSLELRPAMLDDFGLLAALRWHLDRFRTQFDIKVNFKHEGLEGRRLEPEVEIAAYRIVQEALTNVARHAKIDKVDVSVSADEDAVRVRIQDKGAGFDPHSMLFSATGGLSGMRERATLLGGWLKIDSVPGSGALVSVELPLGKKASAVRQPAGEGRQAVEAKQ